VVPTDADGRVTAFIEKPPKEEAPTDLINAGTYVVEPAMLDRIAPDVPVNVERVTFPALVADRSLYAYDGDTYWIDAGTPATYLAANLDLLTGARGTPEVGVHDTANVAGTVARSFVGAGARVDPGGQVHGSVLFPGAVVRPGAMVRDSVVGPRAVVGEGAVVEAGSVLGDDVIVPDGAQLSGARVPEPPG
jgi:mannose-1-phosphate guanylyltransferase